MKRRLRGVCELCRSRKLGCDGKRPSCSQCVLRRRECPGYSTEWVFLHTSASAFQHKEPVAASNLPLSKVLSWPLQDIISLCAQNFVPFEQLAASGHLIQTTPRICGAWIEVLPSLLGNSSKEGLLSPAIKALAISIVARGPKGLAPLSDAYQAQCSAIRHLRPMLCKNLSHNFNITAASMMCLFLAEVILPTSVSGSSVHAEGISHYIQLHSPDFYASGIPHRLFVGFLPMLILHSFLSRTSSFIVQDVWRDEPFTEYPITPLQALLGDCSAIPAVLEQIDKGRLSNSREVAEKVAFTKLLHTMDSLDGRYYSFTRSKSGLCWHLSGADHATLSFPDITTANFLTHYWAFWIFCFIQLRLLHVGNPALEYAVQFDSSFVPWGEKASQQAKEFAVLIIRSIDYLTEERFALYGIASISFPFQAAYSYLMAYDGAEGAQSLRLAQKAMHRIQSTGYQDMLGGIITECRYPLPTWS